MSEYRKNLNNMRCLDIFTMFSNKEEQECIKEQIRPSKYVSHPLASWDISSIDTSNQKNIRQKNTDQNILLEFKSKFNWQVDIPSVLNQEYQALVLTDQKQVIRWVNKGFAEMTGYPVSFAIGKKPTFLQGKKTSSEIIERFKKFTKQSDPFSETIVNYRKSGEEYLCKITVFPLEGINKEYTHFLALEQEVSV